MKLNFTSIRVYVSKTGWSVICGYAAAYFILTNQFQSKTIKKKKEKLPPWIYAVGKSIEINR